MISNNHFYIFCYVWLGLAGITFIALQFVTAPYGRHVKKGWGSLIPNQLGWFLMELPSFAIMFLCWIWSESSYYAQMLFGIWSMHYFLRTFVFPFRIKTKGKKMPISIMWSGVLFNIINAGINAYYLSVLEHYSSDHFYSWNFYLGAFLFGMGFLGNQISDTMLIRLRTDKDQSYKIPRGFLFKYVSCPNHFFEIMEWAGFAIMAWSLPALCFLAWTAANLLPRAMKHHQWYLDHFPDYPENRKSIIPFVL